MKELTKAQLQRQLKGVGIPFTTKMTKGALLDLANEARKPKRSARPQTAKRPSIKEALRALFPIVGDTVTREEVLKQLSHVKPETVTTMISDLKNPRYCGGRKTIEVRREGRVYVRVR